MVEKVIAGKDSICRTFEFINYNIPPDASDSEFKFNYTTIGFFDALRTDRLGGDGRSSQTLDEFGRCNEAYALHLDGRYSFQNMLAIRKGYAEEDDEFWKEDHDMPLCFVAFFQLKGMKQNRKWQDKACSLDVIDAAITEAINDVILSDNIHDTHMKSICYQTLDKNDFIAGIKSNRYDKISDMLLRIHENMKKKGYPILYSYSIFAVHNNFIKSMTFDEKKKPAEYAKEDPEKCRWIQTIIDQEEKISSISFQGITNTDSEESEEGEEADYKDNLRKRYTPYIAKLHNALYNSQKDIEAGKYNLYEIIGDFDFRYIAREIPLENLLWAMSEKGPLNYRSDLLKSTLYSSMLVLNTCNEVNWNRYGNPDIIHKKDEETRCDEIRNHLLRWGKKMKITAVSNERKTEGMLQLQRGESYKSAVYETFYISLWKILVSLAAIERAPSQKYDFESFYWPFRRLIELLTQEKIGPGSGGADVTEMDWSKLKELSRLIKCLSTALHGSLRTDIQFFQVTDFNVFVNYAPAKLRAFYSAWIKCLVDYYKAFRTEKLECQFVISMNTSPVICTRELTHSDIASLKVDDEAYRLMYIEMPERLLYQPEYTSVILAHEIGHYGDGTAKRRIFADCEGKDPKNNRYNIFIQCVSAAYALLYHSRLMSNVLQEKRMGDKNALLLMRMLQLYLDDGDQPIQDTDIYRCIYDYLNSKLYDVYSENEQIPKKSGNQDAQYGNDAIKLTRAELYSFCDRRIDSVSYMNASIACDELYANFRMYVLSNWEKEEWIKAVTEDMKEVPLWTKNLMGEILEMFQNINIETERNMQIYTSSPMFDQIPKDLMDLLREPYVDLLAILSMHLEPDQYFDLFLKTNQLEGEEIGGLQMKYDLAARIFAVIQTMEDLSRDAKENSFLKKWHNLLKKREDDVISKSLYIFGKAANDSNFSLIEKDKWQDAIRHLPFVNCDILSLTLQYLKKCCETILEKDDENPVAEFIAPIFSKDIFEQMKQINQKLWEYERSFRNVKEINKN